jgi:uncharacterized alpha-E superfamily protein
MTLLSRTADNLFWMGRHMERADFGARLLDAAQRFAALPAREAKDEANHAWASALASAGVADHFRSLGGDDADETAVREFIAFSPENSSSILSCLEAVRHNARSVRTALTAEVWESINGAWNELSRFAANRDDREAFVRFLDWLKTVTLTFDGAATRTMLRNDCYWFLRLGGQIERADNTARLLDVKYHLLLPAGEKVGAALDYFQWNTLLREVSAHTAYRWLYRSNLQPWLIADMLILNRAMPRSLACCQETMVDLLNELATAYGRRGPSQRRATGTMRGLASAKIDGVFQGGLHEFITDFLAENNGLASDIAEQYLL